MCEGKRVYTASEVSSHSSKDDCWVIIDGNVYDVTSYVPKHPGGAMIYVNAGGDCTHLFHSYHISPKARAVLAKYEIGTVEKTSALEYELQGEKDVLYDDIKKEVHAYFQEKKLHPRFSTSLYVKTAIIMASIVLSAYWTFFADTSYMVAMLAAMILGIAMAEVGVSIQHDANHGSYSRNTWICHSAGLLLDAMGASSFYWKQQHVVGHHVFTNVSSQDPDIRVAPKGKDVRRISPHQPKNAQHIAQHLYLGILYGVLGFKSIFLDDFLAMTSGFIGPVKVRKIQGHEAVTFWLGKTLFGLWWLAAPLAWSPWNVKELLGLWSVCLAFVGWMLAFLFQVAHVVEEADFLEKNSSGVVSGSWAACQLRTSADFSPGSWFWTHFSGGLNHQVVHHLFPGVNHTHYPALSPIIQRVCAKHGVKYNMFPTFYSAMCSHFRHLRNMGAQAVVPSLHTIG